MRLNALIATPLMLFLLTNCGGETIKVGLPPPPADYFSCQELPATPQLEGLQAIEASNGALVYPKPQTDARDADIARYIVSLREAWFDCSNALQRVQDYYDSE